MFKHDLFFDNASSIYIKIMSQFICALYFKVFIFCNYKILGLCRLKGVMRGSKTVECEALPFLNGGFACNVRCCRAFYLCKPKFTKLRGSGKK